MKFIGITGGVGAGKSAVLTYLSSLPGVRTMFADVIAAELMAPGGACYDAVKDIFAGECVYLENGQIDRPAMAQSMFADDNKRKKVNCIVHPAVKQYVLEQKEEEEKKGELDFLFLEAALLIEEHYDKICDEIWYIYASKEVRRQRLAQNRGYSEAKIDQVFASQLEEAEYIKASAKVIDNNRTVEEMINSVAKLLKSKGE